MPRAYSSRQGDAARHFLGEAQRPITVPTDRNLGSGLSKRAAASRGCMEAPAEWLGESPASQHRPEAKLRQLPEGPAGRSAPSPQSSSQGETGTGKGLVARLIHRMGPRKGVALCRTSTAQGSPGDTARSRAVARARAGRLHRRAPRAKPALLHTGKAHRGTFLPDEVGLLLLTRPEAKPPAAVIEERVSPSRLGSTRPEAVDARFTSATNIDLQAALRVRRKPGRRSITGWRRSRSDLPPAAWSEVGTHSSPLQERFSTEPSARPRAYRFEDPSSEQAQARPHGLSPARQYPGELANVMERAALFADSPGGHRSDAWSRCRQRDPTHQGSRRPARTPGNVTPEEAMRQHLQGALEQSAGITRAPRPGLALPATRLYVP